MAKKKITISGVSIGDKFVVRGKNLKAVVVDFYVVTSMTTGKLVTYTCIAQGTGVATNTFEVPFSTVIRGKIN
jgi:hypothetical protein